MAVHSEVNGSAPPRKLVGHDNFVMHNPRSDRFDIQRFHHIEFYCTDATMTTKRLQHGLGLSLTAKSDLSTGNTKCASYVIQSGELVFVVTAPLSQANVAPDAACPLPDYDGNAAFDFVRKHGTAVRAVGTKSSAPLALPAHDAVSGCPAGTL